MDRKRTLSSQDALDRFDSAMVDADIEGLAQDPELETLIAKWRAEGLDPETRIARVKTLLQSRKLRAAE